MFVHLIRFHLNYVFNKVIFFLLASLFLLTILFNTITISGFSDSLNYEAACYYYISNCFPIIVFICNLFSIVLFSYSFIRSQDQYMCFVITSNISKREYFITKYISLLIVCLIFLLLMMASFYLPLYFYFSVIYINVEICLSFFDLLLQMLFYGLQTLVLIVIFNNLYLVVVNISVFIVSFNITDKDIRKYLDYVLISLGNENWRMNQSYFYCLIIIIGLLLIISFIYQKNDV